MTWDVPAPRPEDLPAPQELLRRHRALVAVEDLLTEEGDGFRYFFDDDDCVGFSSGSGDDYRLVLAGDEALLTVFDHESDHSPWAEDLSEWPGMFDGLPDHLRAHLPPREDDEPLSVSAAYWFTGGRWHKGAPEPVEDAEEVFADDPGGAGELLKPLLDLDEGVRELVVDLYEQPEKLDAARALSAAR